MSDIVDDIMLFESRGFPTDDLRARIMSNMQTYQGSVATSSYDYRYFLTENIRKMIDKMPHMFQNMTPESIIWPTDTSCETMLLFLQHIGILGLLTPNIIIAKYLSTLEHILSNFNGTFFENVMHLCSRGILNVKLIQMNVSFIAMSNPGRFLGTPYTNLSQTEIFDMTNKLMGRLIRAQNFVRECEEAGMAVYEDREPQHVINLPIPVDMSDRELKPHQMLLEHLFQHAGAHHLRRTQQCVFSPIHVPGTNIHTHFYRYIHDIYDWLFQVVTPIHIAPEMYDALTLSQSTPKLVTEMISKLPDARFPYLEKDRCLFSFRNGIFNARNGMFYSYVNDGIHTTVSNGLGSAICTSNFFNIEYTDDDNIDTPSFQKIMDDQMFDAKTCYWFQVLTVGRMLHDVNAMDKWQVAPYLKGVAGSGKSTWFRLVAQAYEASDIGYLADDCEEFFSDQHLIDSKMVLCLDTSTKFRMTATRLNSYVTGEEVVINRKHKTSLTKKWKSHIAFASNVDPSIESNAGSGARRFVIFCFEIIVTDTDPQLLDRCVLELPMFLVKCSRLYLDAVRKYGDIGLWDDDTLLPIMCHKAKEEYIANICPITGFLCSDKVEYDETFLESANNIMKGFREYKPRSNTELNRITILPFLKTKNCSFLTKDDEIRNVLGNGREIDASVLKHGLIVGLRICGNDSFGLYR